MYTSSSADFFSLRKSAATFRQRFAIWIQFFSSSVSAEIFQNSSGNWKTKKLKNSRDIQAEILHMDSVFQFFSFSVSGTVLKYFRRNWKIEKLNFPRIFRQRFSIWIQFFSFLVFQFFSYFEIETEKLKNQIFQGHSGRDSPYGFSFSVF